MPDLKSAMEQPARPRSDAGAPAGHRRRGATIQRAVAGSRRDAGHVVSGARGK
ncbi:MAG: hypothetical protein MZV64_59670 [Ignavibacteriales bacterium]|nr:hypothetical protein [Ignavibacteriales bacterium]